MNGGGRLDVLQSYAAREGAYEVIWPEAGGGSPLLPPTGTELFFVCGRGDRAPTVEELRGAWESDGNGRRWSRSAGFSGCGPRRSPWRGPGVATWGTVEFPETDQVKQRLEQFRERLRDFRVLDGVAFRHQ